MVTFFSYISNALANPLFKHAYRLQITQTLAPSHRAQMFIDRPTRFSLRDRQRLYGTRVCVFLCCCVVNGHSRAVVAHPCTGVLIPAPLPPQAVRGGRRGGRTRCAARRALRVPQASEVCPHRCFFQDDRGTASGRTTLRSARRNTKPCSESDTLQHVHTCGNDRAVHLGLFASVRGTMHVRRGATAKAKSFCAGISVQYNMRQRQYLP